MSEDNKAIIRRFVDHVLNGGHVELVDQLLTPDYVVHDPSNPNRPNEIEGAKAFIRMFQAGRQNGDTPLTA
jgi:predicted SnoaL-like aldol condensation-catalyzing enzyme